MSRTPVSVPDQTPQVAYAASAVEATEFPFSFPYWEDEDLVVRTRPVDGEWTVRFDYDVVPDSGTESTGYPSGAVVFTSPVSDLEVLIRREKTFERVSQFLGGTALDLPSLNRDMNRAVGLMQTLRLELERTIKLPVDTTVPGSAVEVSGSRASTVLAFDELGNVVTQPLAYRLEATPEPVATITALLAIVDPVDGQAALVTDDARGGVFVYDSALALTNDGGITLNGWVRKFSGPVLSSWFAAGAVDSTLELQAAIDAAVAAGLNLEITPGTYTVSKNSALAGFPNNDQPCLLIDGASGMRVYGYGAVLQCDTHGQGILEITGSTDVLVEGVTFVGPGSANWPPIDGTTGHSEKGSTATGGYNTTGFWGIRKNNSQDTSANNTGGFGGAFPQYGGGTAATWGMWNGGFIGNIGSGVLVYRACSRITFRQCKASGFNYAGFQVGFRDEAAPGTESFDVRFLGCISVDNYSRGISTMDVDGVLVEGCVLSGMGHPDATPETDTYADPGYGYSASGWPTYYTRNGVVRGNLIKDCVRKGVDSHASDGLVIEGNVIRNCAATGISVPWTDATQPVINTVIRGNSIKNCGYASGALATILGGGPIDAGYSYANSLCNLVIDGNLIEECGGTGIEIKNGRNIQITNNILRGFDDRAVHGQRYFMFLGRLATVEPIYNLNCSGNVCDADGDTDRYRGISVRYARNSQVNHNMIYMDHAAVSRGLDFHQCTTTQAFGNVVYSDPASLTAEPFDLRETDGMTIGNLSDPDAGALSYPIGNETTAGEREKRFRLPHMIQLDITFNGTASPSYVVNAGEDYVASVQELATYGVSITFKNLESNMLLRSFLTEKSAGGLSTGGGFAGFIYERALSSGGMEIGLKTAQNGSNILASAVSSGTLSVTLMVF